jgi:GNAT superfamily N-acetyltransferase
MWWRLTRSQFAARRGPGTRRALKRIVDSGSRPGIIAYSGREPVGWCSVAPREEFSALSRSRILQPVDDRPVWSVVCFYVARPYRRTGVTAALLDAAARFAARRGATLLEGYPVEPKSGAFPDVYAFTGLASAFRKSGFQEVARRSPTRPIFRRELSRGR